MKRLRTTEIIGVAIIALKFGYFLKLIDAMAPIMDIIAQILYDIVYFLIILAMFGIIFTC